MNKKVPKAPAEVVLHRDLSTNQQIGMLLSVCNTMLGALINPERDHENIPGKRALAGEAHVAAEHTFIQACDRLDKILDDSERWGMDYQLRLEQQYNERHSKQMAALQSQQEADAQRKETAAAIVLPQFRYKPMLIKLEEGGWAAFLGNIKDLDSGILGIGDNPKAALASFDLAFSGKMTPEVQRWLHQREADLEQGNFELKPFPKLNEIQQMDPERGQASQDTPSPEQNDPGDSPNTGAFPGGS